MVFDMYIQDWLNRQTITYFVGRRDMMALMQRHAASSEWQLLHLYGPGGIGKTTLLQRMPGLLPAGKTLYVDDHTQLPGKLDSLAGMRKKHADEETRIRRIVEALHARADRAGGTLVLLVDGFEPWSHAANWFRERLLPRLRLDKIKLITAGRHPLLGDWQESGWQLLVSNVPVAPLEPADIRQYAALRGIVKKETVDALVRFSRGVPLAMSMASELILRNGNVDFLQPVERQMLIGMLAGRLMRELAGTPLERYAEAASLLLKIDQELLQTIIGEPVTTDRFREFCDMPVVVRRRDGWALHDAVREWIAADFQIRKPSGWQETKHNALAALKAKSDRHPALQTEISFELIFLHDSPFIRSFCFQLDNQLDLRPVREADLPRMEWLYLAHMRAICGADPADPHLAPLIRPLWNLQPESFLGLWQDRLLVAFIACHRLDDRV